MATPTSNPRVNRKTHIVLRTEKNSLALAIPIGKPLQTQAMRWNYIVRQRHRWSGDHERTEEMRHSAHDQLKKFAKEHFQKINRRSSGASSSFEKEANALIEELAAADFIEVDIPYEPESETTNWEGRIFPWEFFLSGATKYASRATRTLVTRHMVSSSRTTKRSAVPKKAIVVESAPNPLRDYFVFEGETQLVSAALDVVDLKPVIIQDPTRTQFKKAMSEFPSSVIHIAGIDSHQGAELLGLQTRNVRDGFFISKNERKTAEIIDAEGLSQLIDSSGGQPALVSFNIWDSGSRLVPMAVAGGARASIGFEHTFDDSVAEMFFSAFYRNYKDGDLLTAFAQGLDAVRPYREKIRGCSIVLCSAVPLVKAGMPAATTATPSKAHFRTASPKESVKDLVAVEVTPTPRINYALMHNGRSIMDKLTVRWIGTGSTNSASKTTQTLPPASTTSATTNSENSPVGKVDDIDVSITLCVGADSFPYRTRVEVSQKNPIVELGDAGVDWSELSSNRAHVPLTSELARSVDEAIQTSLFIEVMRGEEYLYRQTHRIQLAPVDEWQFESKHVIWLPSFVQPRDDAVHRIVSHAQKYLSCLKDYPYAGFDGYQSYDGEAVSPNDEWTGIDQQVQAIWHALLLDTPLGYINPPPSYVETAQRLRTPGQIMREKRGTCIDLALLVASCLEWIEVYPVIFMHENHAFPGYWRSQKAYEEFRAIKYSAHDQDSMRDMNVEPSGGKYPPWYFPKSTYQELRSYVQSGDLVPLESVDLTNGSGFETAKDEAKGYFKNLRLRKFDSMVDIMEARLRGVTPLPILDPKHAAKPGVTT